MNKVNKSKQWSHQFRKSFQEIEINPLEEGATTLMYACQQENLQQLRSVLKKKPNAIKERDRSLKTALHYCAENVTVDCAEALLNVAPEIIDVADEDGYTTLHLAVIAGNLIMVNFLISKSADVNKLDSERHSVIHWATVCGEVDLLEILLKYRANPSTPDIHGGYPIHYAAQMCGTSSEIGTDYRLGLHVLKVLLAHNVDVTVVDHDGRSPLLWAASAGSSDGVLALINAGSSVRSFDKDGLTALHCAASRGHTDCLETLVELCGADVDVTDNNGCTALFYSVTLGHADATNLLLSYKADPNRQDRKGRTPAHCGATKGQLETLKILNKRGANLWIRNIRGDYPLHEAVNSGRKELVCWLLAQHPDAVNASNLDGRCPLHIASINNNVEMCKILLDHQSLVNPVMRTGKGEMMTPLDAALQRCNRGCAKYLQLHGGVPAAKLTSVTAALRGSRRTELHSDHQIMEDSKILSPSDYHGNYRSLNSSPSSKQTSYRSRKVQVHISADVSSETIENGQSPAGRRRADKEVIHYKKKSKRSLKKPVNIINERKDRISKNKEEEEFRFSVSSSDDDSFSCESDDSLAVDVDDKKKRYFHKSRRRQRRESIKTRRPVKRRSMKQEMEHITTDDRADTVDYNQTADRSSQRFGSSSLRVGQGDKSDTEISSQQSYRKTVLAQVHREDEADERQSENEKTTTTSSNGFEQIRYEKLETTDTEVTPQWKAHFEDASFDRNERIERSDSEVCQQEEISRTPEPFASTGDLKKNETISEFGKDVRERKTTAAVAQPDEYISATSSNVFEQRTITEDRQMEAALINEFIERERSHGVSAAADREEVDGDENHELSSNKETRDGIGDSKMKLDDSKMEQGDSKVELNDYSGMKPNDLEIKPCDSKIKPDDSKVMKPDNVKIMKPDDSKKFVQNDTVTNEVIAVTDESIKKEISRSDEDGNKVETVFAVAENEIPIENNEVPVETNEVSTDPPVIDGKLEQQPTDDLDNEQKLQREYYESDNDGDEEDVDDRGLVCIIPDDYSIDGSADILRQNLNNRRSRSVGQKRSENVKPRRRSNSSFEVLSGSVESRKRSELLDVQDDSGFEPSPGNSQVPSEGSIRRSRSRIPRAKRNLSVDQQKRKEEQSNETPDINVTSVTQAVQNSMRRYHLERRIFNTLLELKRLQIKAGKSNEQVAVKRLIDDYKRAGLVVGIQQYDGVYSFKHFERYLYDQLRSLQSANKKIIPRIKSTDDFEKLTKALKRTRAGKTLLETVVPDNPLFCTHGTHRCLHATHAYTGIPCAAYITKMDHHQFPKGTQDAYRCFLPRIDVKSCQQWQNKFCEESLEESISKSLKNVDPSKPVTLELIHGSKKQTISLPTKQLDKNKRYYVTFTIKGNKTAAASSKDCSSPKIDRRNTKSL